LILKHLAIELSEVAVRFTAIGEVANEAHTFFFKDKIDHSYKVQLDNFLEESGFKNQSFEEYTIGWSSFRSTLMPSNVFGETNSAAIFKLCYGDQIDLNHIDYNRIPELNLVNIYEIPLWVKSFFVIKFPRCVIQHDGSHLLRGVFAGNTFQNKAILVIYSDRMLVSFVKENKLEFYATFTFTEVDDLIYHFMHSLHQKELVTSLKEIKVCNGVGSNETQLTEFIEKLAKFSDLKNCKIKIDNEFLTNSQQLCV
jgi:hypothetical protein